MPSKRRNHVWVGRALVATCFIGVLACLVPATAVSAHTGTQSYLYVDVSDRALGGRVELPMRDIRDVLGIDLRVGGDELTGALESAEPTIRDYVADHLSIGDGSVNWPIELTTVEPMAPDPSEYDTNYVIVGFLVDRQFDPTPRHFEVTFDPFFDEISGRDAVLLVGTDVQAGVYENVDDVLVRFTDSHRTHDIRLGDAAWWKNFRTSVSLGVDHIRTGPDHVLFMLVLLLPAVLAFDTGRWRPATSFGGSLLRVLKIATMFTLAHTITFSLAGLELVPLPPSRLVEAVIALSIAAAAAHNLRPVVRNREWVIAFAFGLFHGMGFATLVDGLDTTRTTQLVSLAGRNIGIELAQAGIIVAVFPALFLLRRTTAYLPVMSAGSVMFALVALAWFVERAFDRDLGVAEVVDPWFDTGRALSVLAVFAAAALCWRAIEARRGRLISAG